MRATYVAVLCGSLLWCLALAFAPLCAAGEANSTAAALYGFFHRICHQIPERSFVIAGWPLAVCVRCSSIYTAFLIGTIFYPLLRPLENPRLPSRALLVIAGALLAFDGLSLGFLFYDVSNATRAVTGILFGAVLPFTIIPAAQQAVQELLSPQRLPSIHQQKGLSDA